MDKQGAVLADMSYIDFLRGKVAKAAKLFGCTTDALIFGSEREAS